MTTKKYILIAFFALFAILNFSHTRPLEDGMQLWNEKLQKELWQFNDVKNELEHPNITFEHRKNLVCQLMGMLKIECGKVVDAVIDAKVQNQMIGKLTERLNSTERKLLSLQIPLVFRNYVHKIEDMFLNVKAVIPANATIKQKFLQNGTLQRKYNWITFLSDKDYSNDVYVALIKTALKKEFFSQENIPENKEIADLTTNEKQKYEEFLDIFCEGIAVTSNHVDEIVDHRDFGREPTEDLMNVFQKAYDKYVSIFYQAIVGSPIPKKKSTVSEQFNENQKQFTKNQETFYRFGLANK